MNGSLVKHSCGDCSFVLKKTMGYYMQRGNTTILPHFMLHAGIRKTYQKLVGESLVPIPACRYKAGDAGISGDAQCRRWERTSYLLTDDEDHTGLTVKNRGKRKMTDSTEHYACSI